MLIAKIGDIEIKIEKLLLTQSEAIKLLGVSTNTFKKKIRPKLKIINDDNGYPYFNILQILSLGAEDLIDASKLKAKKNLERIKLLS